MNTILLAALAAWIIAQTVKVLFGFIRYGRDDRARVIWRIIWAGGMPSVHSSVITSVAITILHTAGAESAIFGLAAIMSLIVIYDRSRMYSIYNTFQKRYPDFAVAIQADPVLKDLVGHRPSEIIAGVIIGAVSGLGLSFL
jgi:uncharacterized protein